MVESAARAKEQVQKYYEEYTRKVAPHQTVQDMQRPMHTLMQQFAEVIFGNQTVHLAQQLDIDELEESKEEIVTDEHIVNFMRGLPQSIQR